MSLLSIGMLSLSADLDRGGGEARLTSEKAQISKAGDDEDGRDWSVHLRATGGELARDVVETEVRISKSSATAKQTRTPARGEARTADAAVTPKALRELREAIREVKAWELEDFRKPVLDAPEYVIRLKKLGKTHTVSVQGAGRSDKHLKLILAIQRCFPQGASP